MLKVKTTQKAIKESYSNILVIPYCSLQSLLTYEDARFYTVGVCGWDADVYVYADVAICTGYRPFGTYSPSYSLMVKFNKTASEYLLCDGVRDFQQAKAYLRSLLDAFIREVKEEQKQASRIDN